MSDATTRGIRIQVQASYLAERSAPQVSQYLFAYTVTISNVGEEEAQLVSRKWIITNGDGDVQEVEGPGVVGQQPLLAPGEAFEYTSYCPLTTPVGTMCGTYHMVRPSGERFDAAIAPFTLAIPKALN